ncbi:MAG: tyrosine recombinase XerC [Holosporales bacterium]|jgi:integrase/recombinase XerC|nr:tyrosine recombinase XerC [Holosporales bacterium]
MNDSIKDWIRWLEVEKGYSRNTITSYKIDFVHFAQFMSEHAEIDIESDVCDMKASDLRAWLSSRIRRGHGAKSNARALSSVKSFFSCRLRRGKKIPEFVLRFRAPKVIPSLPRPLTQSQAHNVIEHEERTKTQWIAVRNKALLILLYGAGLRINEALSLDHANINLAKKEALINGKGGKQRHVPLLPIVRDALSQYVELCPYPRSASDPVFYGARGKRLAAPVFERHVSKIRQTLNLKESATPHALRHSFASHLVANGVGIRTVQELLGHASLASTQVYTDISDARLMEIYRETHPLSRTVDI